MAHRTLVIGLGSTGTEVCNRLIERLEWENGALRRTPWIRFLSIETALVTGQAVARTGNVVALPITQNKDLIGVLEKPGDWDDIFEPGRWTNPGLREAVLNIGGQGAGNIRQAGRLALLFPAHLDKVLAAVKERLTAVVQLSEPDAQQAFNGKANDPDNPPRHQIPGEPELSLPNTADVYVVGSLCGGTASGTFIDLPYILRKQPFFDAGIPKKLVAIMAAYPRTGSNNDFAANTWHALQEYNHWATPGMSYRVRVGSQEIKSPVKPYDEFLLVEPATDQKASLDRLCRSVADYIYVRAFSPDADRVDAKRADFGIGYSQPARNGQQANFATFGISGIEYPAQDLMEACALDLVCNAMSGWSQALATDDATSDALGNDVARELTSAGISADALLKYLSNLERSPSVQQEMERRIKEAADNSFGQSASLSTCDQRLDLALGEQRPGVEPIKNLPSGCVPNALTERRNSRLGDLREELSTKIHSRQIDANGGLSQCNAYIRRAAAHLAVQLKVLEDRRTAIGMQVDSARSRQDEAVRLLDGIDKDALLRLLWGRRWAPQVGLDQWKQAAIVYYRQKVQQMAVPAAEHILKRLGEHLGHHTDKLSHDAPLSQQALACKQQAAQALKEIYNQPATGIYISLSPINEATVEAEKKCAFGGMDATAMERAASETIARGKVLKALGPQPAGVAAGDGGAGVPGDLWRAMLAAAREHFRDILGRSVLTELQKEGAAAVQLRVGKVLASGQPLLDINLHDSVRFSNLPRQRARFLFFPGNQTLAGENPPAEVAFFKARLDAAHQADDEETLLHESADVRRITLIHEQTAFPLAAISGFEPGGSREKQAHQDAPERCTFYSRDDVRPWMPVEPAPGADALVRKVLALVAAGQIDSRYDPLVLPAESARAAIHFPAHLRLLANHFSTLDSTARNSERNALDNALLKCRDKLGPDEMVFRMNQFVVGAGASIIRDEQGEPLSSNVARNWLTPYLQSDNDLWSKWAMLPGNAAHDLNPQALFKRMGAQLAGSGNNRAHDDGYYCDECGYFFGAADKDVLAAGSCPRCHRSFTGAGI